MTVTVACVYWGSKFPLDYVYNLKRAVERNTTVPFNFVCYSDKDIEGVDIQILRPGYEGWWNKLQLFDAANKPGDRVVYFDLDTIITGNIDWLLNDRSWFMGIEDVGAVNKHQPHLKNVLQTGVMAFDFNPNSMIWGEFVLSYDRVIDSYRGDGEYLSSIVNPYQRTLLQHKYPNKLKSYKYDVYPKKPDEDTSIVVFHGRPNIEQAITERIVTPMNTFEPQTWIKDYWY
tara:strand:- start:5985 stop:6674 length:690 start_codon:yes stop_codon:yes gene_type:complete